MAGFSGAAPARVNPDRPAPLATDVLSRLARASAALVVDQDEDDCVWLPGRFRPLGAGEVRLCGPAFTVNAPPGDNVAVRLGIERVGAGEVLVIAGKADTRRALVGEILVRQAVARGVAGFLIEGAVRDADRLAELPVPVYCLGSALKRATKYGHGEVGYPIAIANEVVYPGDVIVGDREGVAVIRRAAADAVARKIDHALAYEADRIKTAERGALDLGVSGLTG